MKSFSSPTRRKEARQPVTRTWGIPRFVGLSLGVHLVALILLSIPLSRSPRPIYAEPMYQVALVNWPVPNFKPPVPTHTEEPPKPKPVEEPKPKEPPAREKDVVKVPEKPKPKPEKKEPVKKPETKPEPTKAPETKPQETTPPEKEVKVPDTPEEPVSLGMVDQKDFKEDDYLKRVRQILAAEWTSPEGGSGDIRTTIHFVIEKDGTIVQPFVQEPSGWSLYDRQAMGAVVTTRRLPPLPEAYSGDHLGLTVIFQKTGVVPR
jgi:outer membrane biosynthesis protein TonB